MTEHWYRLPDKVWGTIEANLAQARSEIADVGLEIVALNKSLWQVRNHYVGWFKKSASVAQYRELRPVLAHEGGVCVQLLKDAIALRFSDATQLRYLDIGCGDGAITSQIASYLRRDFGEVAVTAIDISPAQILAAKKQFGPKTKFHARLGPFEEAEFKDKFDVITAIHSLYVIDEVYIHRVFELLARGGIALIWLASHENNIVTALSDAVDKVLRSKQRRNAAEDIVRFAEFTGLDPQNQPVLRAVDGLLDDNDEPTLHGRKLIDYCALGPVEEGTAAWRAAVEVLRKLKDKNTRKHPLTDRLITIARRP